MTNSPAVHTFVAVSRTLGRGANRQTVESVGFLDSIDGDKAVITLNGETKSRTYSLAKVRPATEDEIASVMADATTGAVDEDGAPITVAPESAPVKPKRLPRKPRSEQMTKAEHRTYVIATLVDRFGADVPKERSDLLSAIHEVGDVAYNEGAVFHHTIERFGNGKWLSPTALSDIARKLRKAAKDAS
jgi:hypothetical protein